MVMLFFLIFSCDLVGNCEKDISLHIFSSVWNTPEGGVPPFVFSLKGYRLFKENRLLQSWEGCSYNSYIPLWKRYIEAYMNLHEWYFKIPPYVKNATTKVQLTSVAHYFSLYELAPHKGKGMQVGCIDTGVGIITEGASYNIHPAIQKNIMNTHITYYNCIEDLVHNLFYDVTIPYSLWCSRFRFLEDRLYVAVVEYLNTQSLESFTLFLKRYGNQHLFTANDRTHFSQRGYELLEVITKRVKRVIPIIYDGKRVPYDTIGYACKVSEYLYDTNHGNGIVGIIAGASPDYEGVAPAATVMMAKVFFKDVTCTAATFLEGVLMMIKHKIPIVCMSLQIPEEAFSDDMRKILTALIKLIPYSIAPSGNDAHAKEYISFPGSVATFSIGSFVHNPNKKTFPVASGSQYEKENGPLYVMPGTAFVMPCTTYRNKKIEHTYSVSHGTSFAAAFTTGLLTLFLGEIDLSDFSRREILMVLYSSGLFLQETSDWKLKSILGTLDISTALFIVLVLRAVKHESSTMRYLCEMFFEHCVAIIHLLLKQTEYITNYTKEEIVIFFKDIICSLITHSNIHKTMIPVCLQDACYSLLCAPQGCVFSKIVNRIIEQHAQFPDALDYDLLVRVCGVYEAERIREYVDSYMHYYW